MSRRERPKLVGRGRQGWYEPGNQARVLAPQAIEVVEAADALLKSLSKGDARAFTGVLRRLRG